MQGANIQPLETEDERPALSGILLEIDPAGGPGLCSWTRGAGCRPGSRYGDPTSGGGVACLPRPPTAAAGHESMGGGEERRQTTDANVYYLVGWTLLGFK